MIIRTNRFIPAQFGAYTYGPVILVRPQFANNYPLIAHEKIHVRQFWRYLGFNGLLYRFSKNMRKKFELEAYREQYRLEPEGLLYFASSLSQKYGLDITVEQAIEEIKR